MRLHPYRMTGIGKVATANMALVMLLLIICLLFGMNYAGSSPEWVRSIFFYAVAILTFPVAWFVAIFIHSGMAPSETVPLGAFSIVANAYLWGWILGRRLDAPRRADQPAAADPEGKTTAQ